MSKNNLPISSVFERENFKNDKEIIRICVENCSTSFDSTSPKILKEDKEFILSLLNPKREKKEIVRNFFTNDLNFMIRIVEIETEAINLIKEKDEKLKIR